MFVFTIAPQIAHTYTSADKDSLITYVAMFIQIVYVVFFDS